MAEQTERAGTVAVMQPYLFPYAGYFRLFAAAETFVLLDDVQFPRRGRVHRCAVPGVRGADQWLTLPLAHASRAVQIKDLHFSPHARATLDARLARLPWLKDGKGPSAPRLRAQLGAPLDCVVDFLETSLRLTSDILHLPTRFVRASSFGDRRRGQDHIIALVKALGGTTYVNAPAGRALYTAEAFAAHGIALRFLTPYQGTYRHLLPALVQQEPDAIRRDILNATRLVD